MTAVCSCSLFCDPGRTDHTVCCTQGEDLLCCETCPAVFHLECLGLSAMPAEEQWHCSACVCAACGRPGFGDMVQPQCPVRPVLLAVPQLIWDSMLGAGSRVPPCTAKRYADSWDLLLHRVQVLTGVSSTHAGALDHGTAADGSGQCCG